MFVRSFAAAGVFALTLSAQAATVTQWNFNSPTPDGVSTTGSTTPSIGSGTVSLFGGTTATFASGVGSTDSAATDNTAWNLTNYAAQGTGDKTRGLQALVSTVGFKDIVVSFDSRHSATASRYEVLQYTLNGTTFTDLSVIDTTLIATFAPFTFDLSAITGANNNASFGFRVLATYAPGGTSYSPTDPAGTYGANGTVRFDMLTVSGNVITAVPEPTSAMLLLAGMGGMGLLLRRRLG